VLKQTNGVGGRLRLKAILQLVLLLLVVGCTTVHIQNATVTETRYPGLLVLQVTPLPGAFVTVTQGLGLTVGNRSATLGYLQESLFTAPDAAGCRVFIVTKNAAELKSSLKALGHIEGLQEANCTIVIGEAP